MLKKSICLILVCFLALPSLARTNNEISAQLYAVANQVKKQSPARAAKMKEDIQSFLIEANMLHFNENTAVWKQLPSGYLYDEKSIQHLYLRHTGVYKSPDGKMMGVFDLNCEDYNDPKEQFFGYVTTTDVFFSPNYKTKNGHSKGFSQKFCKKPF